jgi:predicted molibdopterin-dependent oxidoreductase YjgC
VSRIVGDPAGIRPGEPFQITFDGRPVTVRPGETIGAALLAAGIRAWRTTRVDARPRGLFCGIGVCYDCLVVVGGEPSVRACQRVAAPGDVVSTQDSHG